MPQIEIPFTPGQRVRTREGVEWEVKRMKYEEGGWFYWGRQEYAWQHASNLALVEPVIEWERDDHWAQWRSDDWYAKDDGRLLFGAIGPHLVGIFPDPRAVAEATQKMWNEARKGDANG